jgi:hypothetical protein
MGWQKIKSFSRKEAQKAQKDSEENANAARFGFRL